ncbi:MAG: DUF2752 domain-containing protein [Bacteroidales bacterium]|nr:DUF2752 domain-containing protein [Bacteroidales bacterium]
MSKIKLYRFILILIIIGYIWILKEYFLEINNYLGTCLFKYCTTIPCPSCGATRSVVLIIQGHLLAAIKLNPLGFIIIIFLLIAPVWIILDLVLKKSSFYNVYNKTEHILKKKWLATICILLVLINWIWNIFKGL